MEVFYKNPSQTGENSIHFSKSYNFPGQKDFIAIFFRITITLKVWSGDSYCNPKKPFFSKIYHDISSLKIEFVYEDYKNPMVFTV